VHLAIASVRPKLTASTRPEHRTTLGVVNPVLRTATAEDLPEIVTVASRAFGLEYPDADVELFRSLFDPQRFLLACDPDGGNLLATMGDFPFDVTFPGGAAVPAPGLTWVSVATTHRRRGILRALMTEQHRRLAARRYPVALLMASEGGIYGRFGYGPATAHHHVEIDRRFAAFRPGVPDPGGVVQVDPSQARRHAPEVHRRWCASTPGALSRGPAWWDALFADPEHQRGGGSPLFHLVHPDGWAAYRIDRAQDRCRLQELFTATSQAHVALWRVLLGLDLVHTVTTRACPVDDPLPFLLVDPRQVRTTGLPDGMWVRVLDVPAALAARRYAVEVDVLLEVHDGFLGRGGRFRLQGGPDGASCAPTDRAPEAELDIAELGALLLGGHRAHTLARAGVLTVAEPDTLRRLDAAFAADRSPRHGTDF